MSIENNNTAREQFEASAVHALYAAANDLAGIGYTLEEVSDIIARAFQPVPVAAILPVPAEPVPF
jgi:hypothetical protein